MGSPGLDHSGPHTDGTGHDAYDQGMTAPGFTIDTLRLEDAPAIAGVHVASWQDAYAHLLEDHEHWFGAPALERRTAQWTRFLTPGDPHQGRSTVKVGRSPEGQVVGFATGGPSRDADAGPPLELFALYTDRAWYGTGLGRALVEAVLEGASASVWVAAENPRARRFYEKLGFAPDGAEKVEEHLGNLLDIRMVR